MLEIPVKDFDFLKLLIFYNKIMVFLAYFLERRRGTFVLFHENKAGNIGACGKIIIFAFNKNSPMF